jgi:hypothetical protein
VRAAIAAGLLLGCATRAGEPPNQTPHPPEPSVRETIDETTVGDLGGHRVPMGNMTQGSYLLADGSTAQGLKCSLVIAPDAPGVFVGKGSVVEVGGVRWEVVEIEKSPGELGSVTLERRD